MINELMKIVLDTVVIVMIIIMGLCILFIIGNLIMHIKDYIHERRNKDGTIHRHKRK